MMRLRAALWFSTEICRLDTAASKRDCEAPSVARCELTVSSAVSILPITVRMLPALAAESMVARPLPWLSVPATAVMLLSLVMSVVVMLIRSLAVVFAPT